MKHLLKRLSAAAWLILVAQTGLAQTLVFPHQNITDLRGVLNIFHAFRAACLGPRPQEGLAAELRPEGYQVVPWADYLDIGAIPNKAVIDVLSVTGLEEQDWAGGHIAIEIKVPDARAPKGGCAVRWKRAWDYDDGRGTLATGLMGVIDAQISYHLEAVRNSRPDNMFPIDPPSYVHTSDWYTWCYDSATCAFQVFFVIDPEDGFELNISRGGVAGG